jgi:hypothetical protein
MFKISRIETVEILDKPCEYKDRHADARIDVFRKSAESYIGTVIMQLNLRHTTCWLRSTPFRSSTSLPVATTCTCSTVRFGS